MTTLTMPHPAERAAEALCERLIGCAAAAFDIFSLHLGDQLGYYAALAGAGGLTAAELAGRTGTVERYAREWLEQQAMAGFLGVEDERAAPEERRFFLPPGHDQVLAEPDNLAYLAPLGQIVAGALQPLDEVVRVYREGGGIPFEGYGKHAREGQSRMNRAAFLQQLGKEWIPAMEDVDRRLRSAPPARVADFGCGCGWSSIGIAQAYTSVRVDGFDLDAASIEDARRNAAEHGVAGRVRFHNRDAGDPGLNGRYDLVIAMECVHDMSNPVAALRIMRKLAGPGGTVMIADERVAPAFGPDPGPVERMLYGFSIFHCLPAGMSEQPSAGTGAVMRPDTLRRYAMEAGFAGVEVLPIDNMLFRFYRLRP